MGNAGGGGGRGGSGALGGACGISPDNAYFVDVYQTHDTPPATRLVDARGKVVADLAKSDLTKYSQLGFNPAEMFTYTAADGKTRLHGLIQFPSNFDPARKYPALVSVYGGPASASNTARETFVTPNATAEYGFLILNLDTRSTSGQGKRLLDDVYLKLGQVEVDDMREEAAVAFRNAVRLRPDNADAYLKLGVCLAELNRLDEAASVFSDLARAVPASPIGPEGLGSIALLTGRREEARVHFNDALRVDPANIAARQSLALLSEQESDPAEARRLCLEIQQIAPRTAGAAECIARNGGS